MKKKLIKGFKKKRKQVAKKSKFLLRHPLLVPVTTFLMLFFVGMVLFVMLGASTQGPTDARIVNVYDEGEQRTVTTRAKTVGDLLGRLEIDLIDEDIVEPTVETPILEDNTQINIYRARPVQIIDGERILTVLTAQRAPRLVAEDAGYKLFAEDRVEFETSEKKILASSTSEHLIIDRSVEIKLVLYGVIKNLRTTADTVYDLLVSEQIVPSNRETVEPKTNTPITTGMLVSVNREGIKTQAVIEQIPFDKETKNDDTIQAGNTQVETAGVLGERAVIYEIVEENGVEVSRNKIQEVILREPSNEVVLRGTKIVTPSFDSSVTVAGDKAALMSAAGIAESDFGYVDYIISHESTWRPGATNSYSGAYGLCQSLPASKMASAGADYLTNPITQLKWCSGYATGRYGSWEGAYGAWLAQGWW